MGLTYGLILPYRENRGWGEGPKEQLSPPNGGKSPQQTPDCLLNSQKVGMGAGRVGKPKTTRVLDWLRGACEECCASWHDGQRFRSRLGAVWQPQASSEDRRREGGQYPCARLRDCLFSCGSGGQPAEGNVAPAAAWRD